MTAKYDEDFYLWTQTQAKYLEERKLDMLDFENLIEEIEDLGKRHEDALESCIIILYHHLLKEKYQPTEMCNSWERSIRNSKKKIKKILKKHPGLKPKLKTICVESYQEARDDAAYETGLHIETFPKECPWDVMEILTKNE